MIRKLLSWIGLVALVYVVVFVPMGERTLWQHFQRIWSTDEAQEMSREVSGRLDELEQEAFSHVSGDAGVDRGTLTPSE